jgi:predicted nucleic acid-binding protein
VISEPPAILDTDTLSELSRGNLRIQDRAASYLAVHGRITITSITVFERLRGYELAIRDGKPFEPQRRAFQALLAGCVVLPFDDPAAAVSAAIWSSLPRKHRAGLGDILIAGVACSRRLSLVTRNRTDFERMSRTIGADLHLVDWTKDRRRLNG